MARKSKEQKDRTSIIISTILHGILVGAVAYWAWKSGQWEVIKERILQLARSDKKEKAPEQKPIQQKAPPKLPPINQGVAPPTSSGTRRAVVSEAPAAAGETFFQDTRKQAGRPGSSGTAQAKTQQAVPLKQAAPAQRPTFAPAPPSTVKALLQERAKAAAAIESVGAEQISKSAVSDAGDIVSKVAGATVVEGQYAVIRGLTDRYSAATLNGAELPSVDPYRRSASLDMFPSKIIDRVTVTKTFTPDQAGSFTGGNIDIVTKSFPQQDFFSFELGGAYNTQASLNDQFLTYQGGSLDWLGMDDGSRALPSELKDFNLAIPRRFLTVNLSSAVQRPRVESNERLNRYTEVLGAAPFGATTESAPLNHNFLLAGGGSTRFLGMPLGFFASLPYSRSFSFYDNGRREKHTFDIQNGGQETRRQETEIKSADEVNWAATMNLAVQPFENHELSYGFLYNQYAENSARYRAGSDTELGAGLLQENRLQFLERSLTTHQFKGRHVFPALAEAKMDWLATLSDTTQNEPDTQFYHTLNGQFGISGLPDPSFPSRFFRDLQEQSRNLKLDFTLPFRQWSLLPAEFKTGVTDSSAEREFNEWIFFYTGEQSSYPDPRGFLTRDQLGYIPPIGTNGSVLNYNWGSYLRSYERSLYNGERGIRAGYLMLDVPLTEKIRFIGGARLETTDLAIQSYSSLGSTFVEPKRTNTARLKQEDLLPAMGLVISLRTNLSLRLNYGDTIARPSFRELAGIRSYDPVLDQILEGNPTLKITQIKNYDVRLEWFPRAGEIFSLGIFYKDLKDPIERQFGGPSADLVQFVNRPEATVYGAEFEARKTLDFLSPLLDKFTLGGNLALIESEEEIPQFERDQLSPFYKGKPPKTRPLTDQSAYILNLELAYDNPRSGTSASLQYNVFGPRLIISSPNSPDLYEQPAPSLDFVITQRIGRRAKLKFAAKNLLNPEVIQAYGKNNEAIYSSFTRGMTFGLSFNYEF